MLYNLMRGGLADDFETSVVSVTNLGTYGTLLQDLGVPVHALRMHRIAGAPIPLLRLCRYTKHFRPDLIQGWMYHGNIAAFLAKKSLGTRDCILAWNVRHSLYELENERPGTRLMIRGNRALSPHADALLYNSQVSSVQHQAFGFHSSNTHIIPNGFDTIQFAPSSEDRKRIRNELNIADSAIVVGHIARYHPMKDHPTMLKAMKEVVRRHDQVVAVLVGKDVTWNNRNLLRDFPSEYNRHLRLLGERSDISSLLSSFDLLCLTSAWGEGFPNVLGEAMSTCVPCIATDIGDSALIVGNTGLIVPPRDMEALVAALEHMVRLSPETRQSMGTAARSRVEAEYSLASVTAKYAALYRSLSSREGQR